MMNEALSYWFISLGKEVFKDFREFIWYLFWDLLPMYAMPICDKMKAQHFSSRISHEFLNHVVCIFVRFRDTGLSTVNSICGSPLILRDHSFTVCLRHCFLIPAHKHSLNTLEVSQFLLLLLLFKLPLLVTEVTDLALRFFLFWRPCFLCGKRIFLDRISSFLKSYLFWSIGRFWHHLCHWKIFWHERHI